MDKKSKTAKKMERHFKGVANHRRLDMLMLIAKQEGLAVEDIAEELNVNFKTTSEHVRKLFLAGLIEKKYQGRKVIHSLSPYGKIFYNFIRTFQHS